MSGKPARRHPLSKRDTRSLLREVENKLSGFKLEQGVIEIADYGDFTVYIVDGEPALIRLGGVLLPHLKWLLKHGMGGLPYVTVDPGATGAIGRGAKNLMVPGITGVGGNFREGDVVVIIDERYSTPIAVGIALMDSTELRDRLGSGGKGRAIRVLHRPGDKVWSST